MEWYYFSNEAEKLYLKEQKIAADKIEKRLVVHIAMLGNDKAAIEELTEIVKRVKLTK